MLLRVEPVGSPLGHPDSLVHLIGWTLDEILAGLAPCPPEDKRTPARPLNETPAPCACGRNPLLTFFAAGQQAMREALVLAQAASPTLDPVGRDAALVELNEVLQRIACREIEAFCGVCQFRLREAAVCPGELLTFAQQPPKP